MYCTPYLPDDSASIGMVLKTLPSQLVSPVTKVGWDSMVWEASLTLCPLNDPRTELLGCGGIWRGFGLLGEPIRDPIAHFSCATMVHRIVAPTTPTITDWGVRMA